MTLGTPALHRVTLAASVLLVYCASFFGAFQFDDYNVVVDNPVVHSWASWRADVPQGLRPLLKATYVANWTSGLGAAGFHAFNVFVHLMNALLVYELVMRLMQSQGSLRPECCSRYAFAAALLFAVHPVGTEAVAYISGRSMSLMALFYLGALLCYAEGRRLHRPWLAIGLSPVLFALALATKEVAVTLPFSLVLWEIASGSKEVPARRMLKFQTAHWAILLIFGVLLAMHQRYSSLGSFALGIRGLGANLLTQVEGVSYLLSRLVWIRHLSIDPDLAVHASWTGALATQASLLGLLLAVGISCLRRVRWLAFGILWTFLQLIPTNSVVPRLDVANERQFYLASVGVFLIVAVGSLLLAERALRKISAGAVTARRFPVFVRAAAAGAGGLLVLALGGATILRTLDYRNEIALWESTVRQSPGKARAWNNLGYAYYLATRYDEARAAYLTALRLDPSFELAANNLRLMP